MFVEVALPVPMLQTFDYGLPETLTVQVGSRVLVPFGHRQLQGVVLCVKPHTDLAADKLKYISQCLDTHDLFPGDIHQLLQWASQYYVAPLGELYHLALPNKLRQGEPCDSVHEPVYHAAPDAKPPRGEKQRQLLAELALQPRSWPELRELGFSRATFTSLINQQQLIEGATDLTWRYHAPTQRHPLLAEQAIAVSSLQRQTEFAVVLLEGVTGSGKTEVYLQAIEPVLARGQQVLVLVPEIGLTPQTVSRFAHRFNVPVACWHSNLNDSERYSTWYQAKHNQAAIIIATRSGIFLPFANLGFVIVDEEHDGSFKQQDSIRYHARDLAVMRAKFNNIPLLLGSATPSLESVHNVQQGKFRHLTLTSRATGHPPAKIQPLDIKALHLQSGFAQPTLQAMAKTLAHNEQVLVFLNRRGYAPSLLCHECGWLSHCQRCSGFMTFHKGIQSLICHHCGEQSWLPKHCPGCGSVQLQSVGQGTEQIEEFLSQQFADVPIIRVDRDSTARKGAFAQVLQDIHQPGAKLIIGTQMLAKGHHFPNVTLVVIIDADAALYSGDFRATEHLAQLLEQVAGRAGRGDKAGRVILQTHHPEHDVLQDLIHNGYGHFARTVLCERKQALLPPYQAMAVIKTESFSADDNQQLLQLMAQQCRAVSHVQCFGPMLAPMERKAGKWRHHLHLFASQRGPLRHAVALIHQQLPKLPLARKVRWHVDFDPLDLT